MQANQKVGRLLLVERVIEGAVPKWKCRCECGTPRTVRESNLKQGLTKSCGCLRKQIKSSTMRSAFSRPEVPR